MNAFSFYCRQRFLLLGGVFLSSIALAADAFGISSGDGHPTQYFWSNFAGSPGVSGGFDSIGSDANFNSPVGVAVDTNGTLYVAEVENQTIRQVTLSGGVVTLLAGSPGRYGSDDGLGTGARFMNPRAVAVGRDGLLYVADSGNHTIRTIAINDNDHTVATFAGVAGRWGPADGYNGECLCR